MVCISGFNLNLGNAMIIYMYLFFVFDFDGVGWNFDCTLKKYVYALCNLQLIEFTIRRNKSEQKPA